MSLPQMLAARKHMAPGRSQSPRRQSYPHRHHRHHLGPTTERARCYRYSKSYFSQSSSAGLRCRLRCFFSSSRGVVLSTHHVPIRDGPKTPEGGTQDPKRRGKGEPDMYWYSSGHCESGKLQSTSRCVGAFQVRTCKLGRNLQTCLRQLKVKPPERVYQ